MTKEGFLYRSENLKDKTMSKHDKHAQQIYTKAVAITNYTDTYLICPRIHSGHLAAIEAHPGPIRNALEDMKEVAVWEREHPGNRVSCVSAHRHLTDKGYWWFLIDETT